MKIYCLIVDDESLARQLLTDYVSRIPFLELIGQYEDALQAMEALQQQTVELLFIDIQMPSLTGLELVQSMSHRPVVIFTTAYSEYAVEGFRLDAVDYLVKPFGFERFVQAVQKAAEYIQLRKKGGPASAKSPLPSPASLPSDSDAPTHFFVKADGKMVKVRFADILYIEGLKEYVSIYTPTSRIITLQALKTLEELLPANRFARIHKSYLVPLDRIEAIVGNQVEVNRKLLPIGKTYKEELMKRLKLGSED